MILSRQLPLLLTTLLAVVLSTGNLQAATPLSATSSPQQELPSQTVLQNWIEQMKQQPRGPFKQIRWFCYDGSILPPEPYACREHGGGVQHGEWSDTTKLLRRHNYLIGTLLADLWPEQFFADPDWRNHLKQIMLEQFLIGADNGWILRQARYYRGAIQAEDENWHGEALLLGLTEQAEMLDKNFLLQREAVRLLPHGRQHAPLTEMRQLALAIEQANPDFAPLRIKLHTRPEPADAKHVRLAGQHRKEITNDSFERLAELIERVTLPSDKPLTDAQQIGLAAGGQLTPMQEQQLTANMRFSRSSQLLIQIRNQLQKQADPRRQLDWLFSSIDLEHAAYQSANQLLAQLPTTNRQQRLVWIEQGIDALYGIGFLSQRQWQSQQQAISRLMQQPLSLENYRRQLNQLDRIGRWAEQQLLVQFETQVKHMATLEPTLNRFFQERLRASPLLPIVQMIDSLLTDSQRLHGTPHTLFGKAVSGLRPLNPGLARGRLEIVENPLTHHFSADGIYLLPETIAELPPVAGILTRNAGNSLSHIQLLARNLGIPNLAISTQLMSDLNTHAGKTIILAVSPGGVVHIEADSTDWQRYFQQQAKSDYLINPDLTKLDLKQTEILPLTKISAADSGKIAGPKGANLGELQQIYQQLVPSALIIPFGQFRNLLDNKFSEGQSLFDWMRDGYQQLQQIDDTTEKQLQSRRFLRQLRQQIKTAPLPPGFSSQLRQKLREHFGPDGSYGVFVRSDTNVEDLPNFTGAGLNKTVPHVVGFDNIVAAIRTVWASPFSERAYSWRQAHMRNPEHVYASVLLMKSVPADKSGVLATTDLLGGDPSLLHVAVNEGVGGAVSGQRAEELLINKKSDEVRLLAHATASEKRILLPSGGVKKMAAENPEQLLTNSEIATLQRMAALLPQQFPDLRSSNTQAKPADIEFGFLNGQFVLFQIRPLAESARVKKDLYLRQLDAELKHSQHPVDLYQMPRGSKQ